MKNPFSQSILAGLLSGALVALTEHGLLFFNFISFFAAVPVVYVSLSRETRYGAIAAVVAVAAIVTLSKATPEVGLRYFFALYLPFLVLSACAHMRQPILSGGNRIRADQNEWHPASEIVVWAIVLSLIATLVHLLDLGSTPKQMIAKLDPLFTRLIEFQKEVFGNLLAESEKAEFKVQLFYTYVQGIGFAHFMQLIVNFAIGYKLVERRQPPGLAWRKLNTLDYPESLFFLYLAAFGLASLTSGLIQLGAFTFLVILSTAYFFYGLLIIHTVSRNLKARIPLLILTYSALVIFSKPASFALVVIGIGEPIFKLRQRAQKFADGPKSDDDR